MEAAGYAGLIGHLVLIMTAAPGEYGYGWTDAEAIRLYGVFVGLVHGSPLLGGWIADAFLGQHRAAVLGIWLQALAFCLLIAAGLLPAMIGAIQGAPVREVILGAEIPIGQLGLEDAQNARVLAAAAGYAADPAGAETLHAAAIGAYGATSVMFYAALCTFIAGFGFQSPTLAAMVGSLYAGVGGKREGGYTLLFMAAMLGFIIGGLVSGAVASQVGWIEGLASAGVMVVLAAVILSRIGLPVERSADEPGRVAVGPRKLSLSYAERRRIMAICALCLTYFVFIAAFEQWGGSFSLYVENDTDRVVSGFEIPTLWIHSAQALFVLVVGPIMFGGLERPGRPRRMSGAPGQNGRWTAAHRGRVSDHGLDPAGRSRRRGRRNPPVLAPGLLLGDHVRADDGDTGRSGLREPGSSEAPGEHHDGRMAAFRRRGRLGVGTDRGAGGAVRHPDGVSRHRGGLHVGRRGGARVQETDHGPAGRLRRRVDLRPQSMPPSQTAGRPRAPHR